MNWELADVQAGFRKGRATRDQIANIHIYFCFIDYAKAFDCVGHNKLWKIFKEMGTLDHLTCLLRNLYPAQEATVRTGHGTKDWFQIGKGVMSRLYIVTLIIYITSMQSTSCEMLGWMKHKLESRFPGEISILSDMQMRWHHPYVRKQRETIESLDEGERGVKKLT